MDSGLCRWLFLCNGLSPVELWPPHRFWCAGARCFAVPVVTGVMAVVEGTHDVGASSWVVGAFSSRMVDVVIRAIARIFGGWQVWPKKSSLLREQNRGLALPGFRLGCPGLQDVRQAAINHWPVPGCAAGACLKPRWAGWMGPGRLLFFSGA